MLHPGSVLTEGATAAPPVAGRTITVLFFFYFLNVFSPLIGLDHTRDANDSEKGDRSLLPMASPSAPSCWSSFRPGTSVDVELVCGPQQDGDRLSSMSSELAAAVSPSENSRLGMEKEAESEDSCWSSEAPAVTTDEFSFSSRSKPAGTHQRANGCRPSSQHPNEEILLAEKV